MNNREWLNELAETDPNALQAWFDASRDEGETRLIENQSRAIIELQRKVDNLAHDLVESERLREEMREELSIAYDHAHDLLARRDRGLA